MKSRSHSNRRFRHIISMPVIYIMIVPVVIMDIFLFFYHNICFPLYGLKKLKRSEYFKVDRHKLSYLSWDEKIGCLYCGYVNNFLNYASKIAADTESYFCGIKHKEDPNFKPPTHHKKFAKYGDKKEFEKRYPLK